MTRPAPGTSAVAAISLVAGPGSASDSGPAAVPTAEPTFIGSLSPSRASDFKTCPLLYRFRSIDRLPEPPSKIATRGTVVHAVLERLFDLPAAERTLTAASDLLAPQWDRLREQEPELAEMFDDAEDARGWLESAEGLLQTYFDLEDPTRLEPAEREQLVEVIVDGGLRLRGFVDRLDISPAGAVRVVDYKTGASPREAFEGKALFQLKFYALVIWRTRGVVPAQLKLLYLKDGDVLTYSPEEQELQRFQRNLYALWEAIDRATQAQDFRPHKGRLCDWCSFQSLCPEWGGTPPPYPVAHPVARSPRSRRPTTDDFPVAGGR